MIPHLGISLRLANTAWPALREHALLADRLGYDSLWTSDHFLARKSDGGGPVFEAWQTLAAYAALTTRVRVGVLVSGNTYRHPAIVANMAVTLDHITDGRAILGLGAAWFALEHHAYGIPFDPPGVRVAKLAEAAAVTRALLDTPRTTFHGRYYHLEDAPCEPKPVQPHLPLMIGGGGERGTLRVVARYADYWNGSGTPEVIAHKLMVLRAHCQAVGRDARAITPTVAFVVIIRDAPEAITARVAEIEAANPDTQMALGPCGTVAQVVEGMAAYWRVGVRGFVVDMPAPFDRETLERLIEEVRPRLAACISNEVAG